MSPDVRRRYDQALVEFFGPHKGTVGEDTGDTAHSPYRR